MELYPAIDIQGGRVARASRTDPADSIIYHDDPLAVADRYVAAGARWVHVVDLDRTFGTGEQSALIARLVRRLRIPVQLGGGLWRADDVAAMRDAGVQRVVLGMRALADPAALASLVDQFSDDCLGLAIDVREGRGWSRSWPEAGSHTATGLARAAAAAGVRTLVCTDLLREGALAGCDTAAARAAADAARADVIASGGVNSLADLAAVRDAGLAGAVVGRALFENRFTLEDALACCSRP